MGSHYISAKDILEQYPVTFNELLQLCLDGKLQARTQYGDIIMDFPITGNYERLETIRKMWIKNPDAKVLPLIQGVFQDVKAKGTYLFPFDKVTGACFFISETEYVEAFSNFMFTANDIEKLFPQPEKEESKFPVVIPTSLFAGKTTEAACQAMRQADYADCVIAVVLIDKIGAGLRETGEILSEGNFDERAYRKLANKLKNECYRKYNLRFE